MNTELITYSLIAYLIIHSICLIFAGHMKLKRKTEYDTSNIIDGLIILVWLIIVCIF